MRWTLLIGLVLTCLIVVEAGAQEEKKRRIEVIPFGGYMWSSGRNVLYGGRNGSLKTSSSPMWGVAVDYDLKKQATQLELMYTRQEGEYNFELEGTKTFISDVAIEYFHVAIILGGDESQRFWYTSLALGATHYGLKDDDFNDEWRFSIGFGLGMKYYLSERFLFRLQGRAPYTFLGDGNEFICDDEGCLKNAGGNGTWQYELSAGLGVVF